MPDVMEEAAALARQMLTPRIDLQARTIDGRAVVTLTVAYMDTSLGVILDPEGAMRLASTAHSLALRAVEVQRALDSHDDNNVPDEVPDAG